MNIKAAGVGVAATLFFGGAGRASAQDCPSARPTGEETPSRTQTLEGRLIYHDGIRRWFELKLDRAQCGKSSVQVTGSDRSPKPLESLRGCRVKSTGEISFSPTGYYSLDLYQDAITVVPSGECVRKPPIPANPSAKPDQHVRTYRVDMHVDYRPGDHPVVFHVRSGGRELRPEQAYASYVLTGGFVLYGLCGSGFAIEKVYGTAAARPSHFLEAGEPGDMAMFDPETAAQKGITDLHLGYSCVRARSG
jgi:hypothetical protein